MLAACSWSSGKDSCFAFYKAKQGGYKVTHIINSVFGRYNRVSFHGVTAKMVRLQAECLGVKIIQPLVHKTDYGKRFQAALKKLKNKGIAVCVFGDIALEEHKDWVEKICNEVGVKAIEPIWNRGREGLLNEFIRSGFKAIITNVNGDYLGKEWIGRIIDRQFIRDLKRHPKVDLCGEKGEYHTFVIDAPIFKRRIEVLKMRKVKKKSRYAKKGYWFLDIQECKLVKK